MPRPCPPFTPIVQSLPASIPFVGPEAIERGGGEKFRARIGYALAAKEVIGGLNRVRNHFGVNRVAQAGALASLADEPFLRRVVAAVDEGRREYVELAGKPGLAHVPSATNFVSIDVGGGERARRLLERLQAEGVFIRMPGVAPLDRCVRITVGTPDERALFAQAFSELVENDSA